MDDGRHAGDNGARYGKVIELIPPRLNQQMPPLAVSRCSRGDADHHAIGQQGRIWIAHGKGVGRKGTTIEADASVPLLRRFCKVC